MSEKDSNETKDLVFIRHGSKTVSIIKDEIPGYEITEPLGWGGMGIVWKAVQKSLGRPVAIKVLHDHLVSDATFLKRFMREAEAVARLAHPNIVQIFDVGQIEGKVFYAMEYVAGSELATIIE